jgi:hypothetical protein
LIAWLRCPNKYKYQVVWHIQAKRRSDKLAIGTMVHRFLQGWNLNEDLVAIRAEFEKRAEETAFTDEELIDNKALVETAWDIFLRYLDEWEEDLRPENMKILHVEEEFTLTWEADGRTLSIRVTPDLVYQDLRTGVIWIKDYKTVDSIPNSREVPTYQMLLYLAAVQAAYPDARVGFVLDYIRRKEPVQPRLNATHNKDSKEFGHLFVNSLKVVDTTYQLLKEFLETEAPALLKEPNHIMRLEELKESSNFFQRDIVFLPDQAIENALDDATGGLLAMESAIRFPRVFIQNGGQSCDQCEFKPLCLAELRGEGIDSLLEAFYEERPPKNEYESEEESAETNQE